MWARLIAILAVFGVCLYFVNNLVNRVGDAERLAGNNALLYEQLKAGFAAQTAAIQAENALKEQRAALLAAAQQKEFDAQVVKLNLDRAREVKTLKDLYEKRIDSTNFNWTERLRLEREARSGDSAGGATQSTGDTGGLAEAGRECYGAFTTLEAACKLTTIDFNRCRAWMDLTCETVGCEP